MVPYQEPELGLRFRYDDIGLGSRAKYQEPELGLGSRIQISQCYQTKHLKHVMCGISVLLLICRSIFTK